MAAEMRTGSANVLLVSIYLQNATPASHYPNADILAQLLPLLEKWQGPWFIVGDFNLTPLEISEAGLPARSIGVVIPPSEPSMDNGNTIDMVFVSRDLAGVTTGDSQSSPPAYAQKGILAGCPVAPALSKVALFPVCKRVH